MTIKEAIGIFKERQYTILKKRTKSSYDYLLKQFEDLLEERVFESIGSEEIYQFLEIITDNSAKSTRRLRYAQIKAFFNLIIEEYSLHILLIPVMHIHWLKPLGFKTTKQDRFLIKKQLMSLYIIQIMPKTG